MNRRTVLRATAWAAPVTVVSVAAPAIAASTLTDCLVFTNATATEGRTACTVYVNTKVQTTQGDPVPGLVVTVTVGTDTRTTEHRLDPWGATDLIRHEFPDQPDGRLAVTFHATAPGCTPITTTTYVTTPTWWKE